MCRKTANNITFYYITNSVTINEKNFFTFKKPIWPIFALFGGNLCKFEGKNSFSRTSGPVTYNFIRVSSTKPKLKQTNDQIPKKVWTNGKTPYFIGPFWNKCNHSRLALKIQRYRVQLKIIASQVACQKSAQLINSFLRYSIF